MRKSWTDDGWRRRFALLPIFLSDGPNREMIWLEWHWRRFDGMCIEIVPMGSPLAQAIEARRVETRSRLDA